MQLDDFTGHVSEELSYEDIDKSTIRHEITIETLSLPTMLGKNYKAPVRVSFGDFGDDFTMTLEAEALKALLTDALRTVGELEDFLGR